MKTFLTDNWFKIVLVIVCIASLALLHEWIVLQETNAAVACEEANSGSTFCVTWYKAEFDHTFPS